MNRSKSDWMKTVSPGTLIEMLARIIRKERSFRRFQMMFINTDLYIKLSWVISYIKIFIAKVLDMKT
jgi:hypothetical protein